MPIGHETVRPMTEGQKTEIQTTQLQAIPPLSFADAANILAHKGPFKDDILTVYAKYSVEWTRNKKLMDWFHFYKENFGLEVNFADLKIPERREGFDRLIVVVQGVTIQQVYEKCKKLFGAWESVENLDEAVSTNDRDAKNGSYAIWVRDRIEADEEWKDKSADELDDLTVKGETLLERLLHELKYFRETGNHLDIKNITLCSGSSRSGSRIPRVSCRGLGWDYGPSAHDDLRAREVVSL